MQEQLRFGQFPQNCLRFKCCLIQVNQIPISNLLKRIRILHHYQVPIEFHVALILYFNIFHYVTMFQIHFISPNSPRSQPWPPEKTVASLGKASAFRPCEGRMKSPSVLGNHEDLRFDAKNDEI
jgi:hypothetical protein